MENEKKNDHSYFETLTWIKKNIVWISECGLIQSTMGN